MKLHHLVADGVSFMYLLEEFCDSGWTNLQVPDTKPFTIPHWMYAWYSFPWKALKAYWLAQCRKGMRPQGRKCSGIDKLNWIHENSKIYYKIHKLNTKTSKICLLTFEVASTAQGFTSYTAFSMEKLKVVRRANKCLFPSVLAGMLSNAFHKQFQSHGKSEAASEIVRMVVPTPYPNRPKKTLVNHVYETPCLTNNFITS